jgi:hypothetical protein
MGGIAVGGTALPDGSNIAVRGVTPQGLAGGGQVIWRTATGPALLPQILVIPQNGGLPAGLWRLNSTMTLVFPDGLGGTLSLAMVQGALTASDGTVLVSSAAGGAISPFAGGAVRFGSRYYNTAGVAIPLGVYLILANFTMYIPGITLAQTANAGYIFSSDGTLTAVSSTGSMLPILPGP